MEPNEDELRETDPLALALIDVAELAEALAMAIGRLSVCLREAAQ